MNKTTRRGLLQTLSCACTLALLPFVRRMPVLPAMETQEWIMCDSGMILGLEKWHEEWRAALLSQEQCDEVTVPEKEIRDRVGSL